jgi:hypothetical protein
MSVHIRWVVVFGLFLTVKSSVIRLAQGIFCKLGMYLIEQASALKIHFFNTSVN